MQNHCRFVFHGLNSDILYYSSPQTFLQILSYYFCLDKHADKMMSKMMPIGTVIPMSHLTPQDATSLSSLPVSEMEDELPGKGEHSHYYCD